MTIAATYSRDWLQTDRPQPMYDKNINRLYAKVMSSYSTDTTSSVQEFTTTFLNWLDSDKLNSISGYRDSYSFDICIGCTHYIDDLYQTIGQENLMIFANDYKYHWRLNNNIQYYSLDKLVGGKQLLISMPFPYFGDKHPLMDQILNRCLEMKIPVHVDAAWLSCSRQIEFDFAHPAIESFAISLSKGYGLGSNRIGLRFTRQRKPGPITIMNDFNMNCMSLVHLGTEFMRQLGPNYLWNKYAEAYAQVCTDFDLQPTKAIHIAWGPHGPLGVRPLLRFLNDQ